MKKEDLFLKEAKRILVENIDMVDETELYYASKLIKSIYLQLVDTDDRFYNMPFVIKDYDGEWEELDITNLDADFTYKYRYDFFTPYYICVEFTDDRHLPVPLLAARDYDDDLCSREGLQQEIIKLGFKYSRALRRAAIDAKIILYESTFKMYYEYEYV